MKLMTKDKSFYNNFFSLFFVLVVQNVIVLSVNLSDNIMLGAYSETALSGVAAVNQIQFVLQQIIMGTGDGLMVLATQYWGQKRTEPIKKIASVAFKAGVIFAALLFIIVSLFPHAVLSIFTDSEPIIKEGMGFLSIIRFTYIIFAITNVLLAALRSVETIKVALYISISTLIINCSINYVLIYGHFGAPRLGARGAAIGTLTARIIELIIVLVYVKAVDKKLYLKLKDFIKTDRLILSDYIHISIPIVIVAALWGFATALQTVILGHMNTSAIAANSVASTLFMILKVSTVGACSAASIIIGKTVGAGDLNKVKEYAKTLQVLFLCIGLFTSIALFSLRIPVLSLYNLSPETKALANSFLLVLCITCIGTAYQMPTLGGIVRGGGDTKFVMKNDIISIWCVVLPLSFLMAFYFKVSPVVVVFCLNSDQIFKCVTAIIKVNSYNWVKKLTRAETEQDIQ